MPTALPEGLILRCYTCTSRCSRLSANQENRCSSAKNHWNGKFTPRCTRSSTLTRPHDSLYTRQCRNQNERLFAEDESRCDGVLLAMAGLIRLELNTTRTDVAFLPLNPEHFIPVRLDRGHLQLNVQRTTTGRETSERIHRDGLRQVFKQNVASSLARVGQPSCLLEDTQPATEKTFA